MLSEALAERLARAEARRERRYLPDTVPAAVDFCSNDYLGVATAGELQRQLLETAAAGTERRYGATGSRLLSGNSPQVEALEAEIAARHAAGSALLFSSGYAANLGLYASLPERIAVFYDEHVHASTKDGLGLARSWTQPFRHNDLAHLERRLSRADRPAVVTVEALYSMDGQFAPLPELVGLCQRYHAQLIVDEAHSVGVYGPQGGGLVQALGLEHQVYARVFTYGKALGCSGAAVVGPRVLTDYLTNFAHSFVYSTALPALSLSALQLAYRMITADEARAGLSELIQGLRRLIRYHGLDEVFLPSSSQIQGIMLPRRDVAKISAQLRAQGFDVKGIRSPTVRRGSERLRLCLHSFNRLEDVERLLVSIKGIL